MRLLDRLQELERQALAVAKSPPHHPLRPLALLQLQRRARLLGLAGGRPEAISAQAHAALVAEQQRLAAEMAPIEAADLLAEQQRARRREANARLRAGAEREITGRGR